ncbi:MAG: DUF6748 domain-containing protein [Gaiellaceae bacterium]
MTSRVGLVVLLTIVVGGSTVGPARTQPAIGSALYTVSVDPRLCPSPLCGGYWVALANGARTRCTDGKRSARCYVAKAVNQDHHPLDVSIPDGALVRAGIESWEYEGIGSLGVLAVAVVYAPAGKAPVSGGYYRVVDTGIRCIRAPCFSYRATQVNGSTRTTMSDVDLGAAHATSAEVGRADAALRTKNGLFARGRFARTADGGRVFRALRLYLRAPQPRA